MMTKTVTSEGCSKKTVVKSLLFRCDKIVLRRFFSTFLIDALTSISSTYLCE